METTSKSHDAETVEDITAIAQYRHSTEMFLFVLGAVEVKETLFTMGYMKGVCVTLLL